MRMGELHAHMKEPTGSHSASIVRSSSSVFCVRFSVKLSDLVSLSNDKFSSSFRIYSAIIAFNLLD